MTLGIRIIRETGIEICLPMVLNYYYYEIFNILILQFPKNFALCLFYLGILILLKHRNGQSEQSLQKIAVHYCTTIWILFFNYVKVLNQRSKLFGVCQEMSSYQVVLKLFRLLERNNFTVLFALLYTFRYSIENQYYTSSLYSS